MGADLPENASWAMSDAKPIFRFATLLDVPGLLDLGREFYDESEFAGFATFSPTRLDRSLTHLIVDPSGAVLVFQPDEDIEGFLAFHLDQSYTEEPIALMFLFYVSPRYRRSPAGRQLLEMGMAYAREMQATAFYAGAMAGIPGVSGSLANLYRKLGFEDLDFWGRVKL